MNPKPVKSIKSYDVLLYLSRNGGHFRPIFVHFGVKMSAVSQEIKNKRSVSSMNVYVLTHFSTPNAQRPTR